MRLLLLNDAEAVFLEQAWETWRLIHAAEQDEDTSRLRVDRSNVSRKLAGKWTAGKREQVAITPSALVSASSPSRLC